MDIVLTWNQEMNLTYLIGGIAAFIAVVLNFKYRYLIYIPYEDLKKGDYIRLSIVSLVLIFCVFAFAGSAIHISAMKRYERDWALDMPKYEQSK